MSDYYISRDGEVAIPKDMARRLRDEGLAEGLALATRSTARDTEAAPYAGPERRVLDPSQPAAPATETNDLGTVYFVRTGSVLLRVNGPREQRNAVMLHNLRNGHRTERALERSTDLPHTPPQGGTP